MSGFGKDFMTVEFRTSVADDISLPIETDDEHGAAVHVAARLVGRKDGRLLALREDVADTLAKASSAKFLGAAKVVDGVIGIERSKTRFHRAEMFIAEREKV